MLTFRFNVTRIEIIAKQYIEITLNINSGTPLYF